MQRKMNIINMQFGTQQSASCLLNQQQRLQENELHSDKIKQYLLKLLLASKQLKRIESVRNIIDQQNIPILVLLIQHYLFNFYSIQTQFNTSFSLKKCHAPELKQQKTKWDKIFSLKYYAILEKQKLQKETIQKLQRKLSQSMLYLQHIKQKFQKCQNLLKTKISEVSKLKSINEKILQKTKKYNIIRQLCINSNSLLNKFNLDSLVYKNPKQIVFDIDHNANIAQNQSQNKDQNVFYRTCYQLNDNEIDKMNKNKKIDENNLKNEKTSYKSSYKGLVKMDYPKTSQKDRKKRYIRKSLDKWTIYNKTQSTMNISEKQKENFREKQSKNLQDGLIIIQKQVNHRENKGRKDNQLMDLKNF